MRASVENEKRLDENAENQMNDDAET